MMQTTELIKAIWEQNVSRSKLLIANGADVNETDESDSRPLFVASAKGCLEIVKLLLDHGAEINTKDRIGLTALVFASAEGHIDIVKFLLHHGARVNATATNTSEEDETDSILGFTIGYPDITRLLLQHKANINAKDIMGCTALMLSLDAECLDNAYVLLEHISEMTDINTQSNEGHTALMYAEMNSYSDIVKILKKAGAKDDYIDKALINTAGMTGLMDIIEFLVKKGANVNAQDEDGMTALIMAAIIDRSDIIQYLIDHGADVIFKNINGTTALGAAQHYGSTKVLDLLKKAGAKE